MATRGDLDRWAQVAEDLHETVCAAMRHLEANKPVKAYLQLQWAWNMIDGYGKPFFEESDA